MRQLPIKSTERNADNNNQTDNISDISAPPVNTKAREILKIVLISVSVIVGIVVCTTVIYFGFLKKSDDENTTNNSGNSEKFVKTQKSRAANRCSDVLANCKECKEITITRNLAVRPLPIDTTPVDNDVVSSVVCTACSNNYYPIYNEDNIIIFCNKICETGDADFCKTCDEIKQCQCGTCNYGYYLPTDDFVKSKCKKCDDLIEHCEECYGSKKSIICKKCNSNYFLNTEKNICEPLCQTGPDNNCKTCSKETNKCDSCNSGYYLPTDDEEKKCKKCSDINDKCEECHGTKTSVKCLKCKTGYSPFYDENNEILECNNHCVANYGEFCKQCNYDKNRCISCNKGYYLPTDDFYKLKCKKCTDVVTNCNECHGTLNTITCDEFIDENINITVPPTKCGWNCETGLNEKCLTCNEENNQCSTCNNGYYLPTDDKVKLECKKCSNLVENCIECYGSTYSITCTKCLNDYTLIYDQYLKTYRCKSIYEVEETEKQEEKQEIEETIKENPPVIPECVTGTGEKCLTCDYSKGICNSCNDGYYLPTDDEEKTKCKKCSVENCQICEGTINSNICKQCLPNFTPIYENNQIIQCRAGNDKCQIGPDELCTKCHETKDNYCVGCNLGYILDDGKCILNYSFRATYFSESPYEKVYIINGFSNYITKLIVDGEEVQPTGMYYNFPEPKIHEVYVLIKIPPQFASYDELFYNLKNLLSIHFTPLFNTSNVESMILMFGQCFSLNYINVDVFDTRKVVYMDKMFTNCRKLTSIDITNFNTTKAVGMSEMFSGCWSLTSIDLSKLYSPKLTDASVMFAHCHSLTSIDLSNIKSLSLRLVEQLFDDCPKLKYINLKNVYTDQVQKMSWMFRNCSSLTSLDLSIFSTKSLEEMISMFEGCTSLTSIDMWQFKTNKVSGMNHLFRGCSNLKYINMASSTNNYRTDIFEGVPNDGTIIVHPTRITNAQTYLSAKGWNIVEATEYKE